MSASVLPDGSLLALVREINEQQQTLALRESEHKLGTLFESLPIGISVLNANREIIFENSALARILDIHVRDLLGGKYQDRQYLQADSRPMPCEAFPSTRALKEQKAIHDVEIGIITEAGRLLWTSVSAIPLPYPDWNVLIVTIDITERKQMEAQRQEAERTKAHLAAIVESSEDAIISKSLKGLITSWNQGAEKIFGYKTAEIIGQPILRLIPPDRLDEEADILRRISRGEQIDSFETIRLNKAEQPIHVSITISPIKNREGQVVGASKIARDISARILAEQEVRRLNDELEQRVMQRTAQLTAVIKELESFTYTISHDLRAPIRAIDSFSHILLHQYGAVLGEEGQRMIGIVRSDAQRMGQLIDDLLQLSRLGRIKLQPTKLDMKEMVLAVFNSLIASETPGQIDFRLGELPPAFGDPTQIGQVWQNLLTNAIKFSAKQDQPVIEVGGSLEGNEVRYYVRDNGIGFDMRYADKLFDVFQRLHSQKEFKGTGVGLAIVYQAVQRNGGRVWAESSLNQGATFYFTLPTQGDSG
jgi:PAS domain S-box-containing protein